MFRLCHAGAESDKVLGAAALCDQRSEVVQLFVEMMNSGMTTQAMRRAIHIHPTFTEAAKNAAINTK